MKTFRFFLIFILTLFYLSSAAATRPFFRLGIETIAYPSTSPLTKTADKEVINSVNSLKEAGYSEEVDQLFLAYKNRDYAWNTANNLLNNIQDIKKSLESKNDVDLIIKKIESYGNLAKLSALPDKGTFPDRMFIKKGYNQDQITIRVIDFVHLSNNKKKSVDYITVVLTAKAPYKKWFLSDIYVKNFN